MTETVKAWVHTENQTYDVWVPTDLADLMSQGDEGWVSLARVDTDEYICLRAKDVNFFLRKMTAAEIQLRHSGG